MVEISFLTESDRPSWEALARDNDAYFAVERDDDAYDRTWRRLVDDGQPIGITARLDGEPVGFAHYLFHAGIWGAQRCYLADLFVDAGARRRGVAAAMIAWVARDAEERGFPRLYWNTLEDSPARGLYDKVAEVNEGLVVYSYLRRGVQNSPHG
ncbi:GNAT family N-acetyltransferase [Amycolatopsis japonica]|uniref:GNAT family N-acetyltransferase n=1 Tax=Amycolatopsis japonica TaxID=208439 RepID=UPI00366B9323